MLKILSIALLTIVVPGLAQAKVFELGDDKPVVSLDIPDAWEPSEFENGVAGTSPEGLYMVAQVVKAASIKDATGEAISNLIEQGVEIDGDTIKQGEDFKLNGMDATTIDMTGKDKEGDASVTIALIIINPEQVLLISTWSTPEIDKQAAALIGPIAQSITALK